MELYVAEYSLIQGTFNVEPLSSCIERNKKNISLEIDTGFQMIGIGSYEQCSKICEKFEQECGRPEKTDNSSQLKQGAYTMKDYYEYLINQI